MVFEMNTLISRSKINKLERKNAKIELILMLSILRNHIFEACIKELHVHFVEKVEFFSLII